MIWRIGTTYTLQILVKSLLPLDITLLADQAKIGERLVADMLFELLDLVILERNLEIQSMHLCLELADARGLLFDDFV